MDRIRTPFGFASTADDVAAGIDLNAIGGRYFEDCNEGETVTRRPADYHGVAHYALDAANAERLWDESLALIAKH